MALPATTTVLRETPLVRALHTAIRNTGSSRRTFVTSSDRLVQMILEEALGLLPATPLSVTTPCGTYAGVALPEESTVVAVSIMRAADCMLGVCRAMMPACAVGKVLIQRDEATALPVLLYAKLPPRCARVGVRVRVPVRPVCAPVEPYTYHVLSMYLACALPWYLPCTLP